MTATIWNSSDSGGNITLSNGNLTATSAGTSGTWRMMRATNSQAAGKFVFEFQTYTNNPNQSLMVGLANASASTASYSGHDANGIGYDPNASGGSTGLYGNGGFISTLGTSSNGQWTMIAVDIGARLVWFYSPNDSEWNDNPSANPATGTGGLSISYITGALFPTFSTAGTNSSDLVYGTANFGTSAFVNAVPAGFSSWNSTQTAFNPSDSGTNLVLSNENLEVAGGGTTRSWRSVRSTTSKSSSSTYTKLYFEITFNTNSSGYVICGLMNATASLANYTGSDTNGCGYQVNPGVQAQFYQNGSSTASGSANNNAVYGFAVDLSAKLIWIYSAATGFWNNSGTANPATGTGGISISAITQPLFVAASMYGDTSDTGVDAIANFGNSTLTYSIPSGFVYWDYSAPVSSPTVWNSADAGLNWVLSGGNLTALKASTGNPSVSAIRATNYQSSGKWMYEVTTSGASPLTMILGISNSTYTLTNVLGTTADSIGLVFAGKGISYSACLYDAASASSTANYDGASQVVDVAVDCGAQLIWWRVNGGSWFPGSGANPATGAGGFAYGSFTFGTSQTQLQFPSAQVYPTMFCFADSSGGTANFGASAFTYALPSGFSGWNSLGSTSSPVTGGNKILISKLMAYLVLNAGTTSAAQDPQLFMIF